VGFQGQIQFDTSKPDGAPRKLMDSSLLNLLGWQAKTGLELGLKSAYEDYLLTTSPKT
jgi:GDP-L-fucose synthase